MDIYPEETLQHDREVQVDMFPACSTLKESTPVPTYCSTTFTDDT